MFEPNTTSTFKENEKRLKLIYGITVFAIIYFGIIEICVYILESSFWYLLCVPIVDLLIIAGLIVSYI